jgi:hypothetical protein
MKNIKQLYALTLTLLLGMSALAQESGKDSMRQVKSMENKRVKIIINEKVVMDDSMGPAGQENMEVVIQQVEEIEKEMETFDEEPEPRKIVETSFLVMDIGLNAWMHNNELGLPEEYSALALDRARSVNFHLGAIQQGINLAKGHVRVVYGLGIEYNNFRFSNDVDLEKNSNPLDFNVNDSREYRKNKLTTQYLTVPLMLHLNTNPKNENRNFHVGLGAQFGYLIRTSQKQKWGSGRNKNKQKTVGDYQVAEQRLGYVVQLGYGGNYLYGKYYPNSMFKEGRGPDVQTVALGFVLSPF